MLDTFEATANQSVEGRCDWLDRIDSTNVEGYLTAFVRESITGRATIRILRMEPSSYRIDPAMEVFKILRSESVLPAHIILCANVVAGADDLCILARSVASSPKTRGFLLILAVKASYLIEIGDRELNVVDVIGDDLSRLLRARALIDRVSLIEEPNLDTVMIAARVIPCA